MLAKGLLSRGFLGEVLFYRKIIWNIFIIEIKIFFIKKIIAVNIFIHRLLILWKNRNNLGL